MARKMSETLGGVARVLRGGRFAKSDAASRMPA
jgi:hypothetical protein